MEAKVLKCPACGAVIKAAGNKKRIVCQYCNSIITLANDKPTKQTTKYSPEDDKEYDYYKRNLLSKLEMTKASIIASISFFDKHPNYPDSSELLKEGKYRYLNVAENVDELDIADQYLIDTKGYKDSSNFEEIIKNKKEDIIARRLVRENLYVSIPDSMYENDVAKCAEELGRAIVNIKAYKGDIPDNWRNAIKENKKEARTFIKKALIEGEIIYSSGKTSLEENLVNLKKIDDEFVEIDKCIKKIRDRKAVADVKTNTKKGTKIVVIIAVISVVLIGLVFLVLSWLPPTANVSVIGKTSYTSGSYYVIELRYSIRNNSNKNVSSMSVKTDVSDASSTNYITINSDFNNMNLGGYQTKTYTVTIEHSSSTASSSFMRMYNASSSSLSYSNSVTYIW